MAPPPPRNGEGTGATGDLRIMFAAPNRNDTTSTSTTTSTTNNNNNNDDNNDNNHSYNSYWEGRIMSTFGRGDAAVGDPRRALLNSSFSSSNCSILIVRAYPLTEIRRTVPCRAVRGNGISVDSTLPPLL